MQPAQRNLPAGEFMSHVRFTSVKRHCLSALAVLCALLVSSQVAAAGEEKESEEGAQQRTGHGPAIASVETSYYGYAGLAEPTLGTFEDDLEAAIVVTSVRAGVPLPFKNNNIILFPGVFFDHTHLEYRGWDYDVTPASEQLRDFYAVGLELGVVNRLADWAWLATRLSWGLYSDMEEVGNEDGRLYGTILADFVVAKGMVLGIGLSYNSDFGYPAPLPFVHFAYEMRWFRTDLMIPSYGELYFLPHERVELGVRARLVGNESRVTYDDPDWNDLLVQLSTIDVGAAINVRLVAGLWVKLFGGASVNRRYKAILLDGEELRDTGLRETWFVSTGLAYRL